MKNFLKLLAVASIALAPLSQSSAAKLPSVAIDTLTTFMAQYAPNSVQANNYTFQGSYDYTAIATEAGNKNIVDLSIAGNSPYSNKQLIGGLGFAAFGDWQTFASSSQDILFTDATNGPTNVVLDGSSTSFQLFQLTADTTLSFLNNLFLKEGTIIAGFGDGKGDSDYDDMIVALTSVPTPAAAFLFAPALLGFMGLRRKAKKA